LEFHGEPSLDAIAIINLMGGLCFQTEGEAGSPSAVAALRRWRVEKGKPYSS
jgi:hypothetical protein